MATTAKHGTVLSAEVLPALTSAEIIEELEGEVEVYKESHRERDGVVRNPDALRTISALSAAAAIVRRSAHAETK